MIQTILTTTETLQGITAVKTYTISTIPPDWTPPPACLDFDRNVWDYVWKSTEPPPPSWCTWCASDPDAMSTSTSSSTSYDTAHYLGAPTDTAFCLPPGYQPPGYYLAPGCPPGYTSAHNTDMWTTCCPSVGPSSRRFYDNGDPTYRCDMLFYASTSMTISVTTLEKDESPHATTTTFDYGDDIYAYGILVASTTGLQPFTHHSKTLTTAQKAGIGVGSAAGFFLIVGAVAFGIVFGRRMANRRAVAP